MSCRQRSPLYVLMGVVCLVGTLPLASQRAAAAAEPATSLQWPAHLGGCGGDLCPKGEYPSDSSLTALGYVDQNVETYVGGNYTAAKTAEAEGTTVAGGDFTVSAGTDYSVGVAGAGSQVRPPEYTSTLPANEDALQVGGDITIAKGGSLHVGGNANYYPLGVEYGGKATSGVDAYQVKQTDVHSLWPTTTKDLHNLSENLADPEQFADAATGTVTESASGNEIDFKGDGTSDFQFFNVTGNLGSAGTQGASIVFSGIPENASIFVNFSGSSNSMHIANVSSSFSESHLATHLLWNFPDAATVSIDGSCQLPGSILVAGTTSSTTVSASGVDGRVYVAGDLTHSAVPDSGGEELHSYAFTGPLPGYGPTTAPTTAPPTTAPPTSAPPTSAPPTRTSTPVPASSAATRSSSPAQARVPANATSSSAAAAPSKRAGSLATTGVAGYTKWCWFVGIALIIAGASIVVLVRRRRLS